MTDQESFNNVRHWNAEIDRYASEGVTKVLIGNKSDMSDKKVITMEQGKALADELKMEFIETSAKDASNVTRAFEVMAGKIKSKVGTGVGGKVGGQKVRPGVGKSANASSSGACCA